jgi:hypothetical protein
MTPEEYVGKREWLRSYPGHREATKVVRELSAHERRLEAEGTTVEA